MDCLHGVLMHGDEEPGTNHKAEDQYLRYQEALKTQADKPGPADAEQEFHVVLMHADGERGEVHEETADIQPEVKKEVLPKDMNEKLHEGMHGPEGVNKHDWDKDEEAGIVNSAGDHEKIMHGELMHGGTDFVDNDSADTGDETSGDVSKGPIDHDKLMHGVLMHGDENHIHDPVVEPSDEVNDIGPKNAEQLLHGVLMHADKLPGKHHSHDEGTEDKSGQKMMGPTSDLLHGILMHGDSKIGRDYTAEDAEATQDVFSDFSKILEMDIDKDLLNMIDLEKILKNDIEEYNKWKMNKPEHENSKDMGSTYIDRYLLEDIQLMKRRYLERDNSYESYDDYDDGDTEYQNNDTPFTADDAKGVLSAHAQSGEGEDMRHDLELMGSTDPLNDRHTHALKYTPHEET